MQWKSVGTPGAMQREGQMSRPDLIRATRDAVGVFGQSCPYNPPFGIINAQQAQSCPRLLCLPGKSTSGCTTRMCLVSASLREKVLSSTHNAHLTFCLRTLCMVSSWRVKSYGREKMVLQGLPVVGLMRSHLCGPVWELRAASSADVIPLPIPGVA